MTRRDRLTSAYIASALMPVRHQMPVTGYCHGPIICALGNNALPSYSLFDVDDHFLVRRTFFF
jgi:hypothetical protein